MRVDTKIITNLNDATVCAEKWLQQAFDDEVECNWKHHRSEYLARLVFTSLRRYNWLKHIEDVSLYFNKYDSSTENKINMIRFIRVNHTHGQQADSMIYLIISFLFIHLSFEGHISLRFGHQIHLPATPNVFRWFYVRGLIVNSVAHVYMASTPPRYAELREFLPEKYRPFLDDLSNNKRSTRQRAAMNMIEALTYSKISSLDNVAVDILIEYYNANEEAASYYISTNDLKNKISTITYLIILEMLDSANGSTLRAGYEKAITRNSLVVESPLDNNKEKNLIKITSTTSDVIKMTNPHINAKEYEIETTQREISVISFGDYTFSVRDSLLSFRPSELSQDNYWKKTQLDFVASATESGTKKLHESRLAYLNSYLFDYLPTFFRSHPNTPIKYPSAPSEFLSFVFVSQSQTMEHAHFGEHEGTIYPVGLLDYIYAITEEKSASKGYLKTNAGRDTIAGIQRYFDYVIAKFSGVPSCKLESNPISDFDKDSHKGYSYRHTVKEKISLDYWVLLRMYLCEVTKVVLNNAENVIFNKGKNKHNFKVNKTIEWLEHKVHIDEFNASWLPDFNIEDWKDPVKFTQYHGLVNMTVMAWSGLRDSNILWLDVRNYSQCCKNEYTDEDFVDLYVNTDKAKTEPYTSQIPGHVMRLLDRAARLRMKVNRVGFNEPIYYNGEISSKWPTILPLLQRTKLNISHYNNGQKGPENSFLLNLLLEFEKCLLAHNKKMMLENQEPIDFESSLYWLPLYANQATFRNTKNFVHAEQDYTATLRNKSTGVGHAFTPLKRAVIWTPHSLRVTFDSVCSVLASPKAVGEICTGQSEKVVGYYTINTHEESALIRSIHDASGLKKQFPPSILDHNRNETARIASINEIRVDENEYLKRHGQGTAINDFGCHSMSSIAVSGMRSPIETLSQASANEISFNRTHICPFNNECPKDVIATLAGEKCCAICPYAIICCDHAVAIGVELKRLGDIAVDLTKQIKNGSNLLDAEKESLKRDRQLIIKSVSGWYARHQFLSTHINSSNFYTGSKNDKLVKHISGSFSGQNIIDRLIESDGVSTMTSPKLEREASKLNRQLTALMNKNIEAIEILEDNSNSESEVALRLIKIICNTNRISETQLAKKLTNPALITSSIKIGEFK
ncbi:MULTISPECIES: hypothetical protein [Aeromonas]|uniref:hypothetical protein n=1 Tax=Aeromonas TaxID=642 RepID=UPI00259E24B4|nr:MULTISPECIES: hypothetical protein [Aeromonas]MDM5125139.1 hypothetical protein [Aeromonas rivipollensis]